MRILRLGTSDDLLPTVAEHERGYRIIEQVLAAETGEPVETIVRDIWPDAALPEVVGRWMDRYEPDVVSLKVSSFLFTYESVPQRLRELRLLGPAGDRLADAALKTAGTAWIGNSAPFDVVRNVARRVVGSAVYFTPEQMVEVMEVCLRRLVRAEGAVVVVRGPLIAESRGCSARLQERAEERRRHVDQAMARLCAELHIHYTGRREAPPFREVKRWRGPDRLHQNAEGQRRVGIEEAEAMLAAWRNSKGGNQPLYLESQAVT